MEYRDEVIARLKSDGLKTDSNIEIVNSLRSKHKKSWEWVHLALDESTVNDWRKYGLALMLKADFQARVDRKLDEKRRRIDAANGHLTREQIQNMLNPPVREIVVEAPWSPWSEASSKKQTRFVQTSEGVCDNELGCIIGFFPDYDYSCYLKDCELGNIGYGGEPAPGALGLKRGKSRKPSKRLKLFDIR